MGIVVGNERSKLLEATLELGRNWALATTLAAFGAASHGTEAVMGIMLHKGSLLAVAVLLAFLWFYLSVRRAYEVAGFKAETRIHRLAFTMLGASLLAIGGGIVFAVASIADNNRVVRICGDYADKPDSAIYRDAACQRLYQDRNALEDRIKAALGSDGGH